MYPEERVDVTKTAIYILLKENNILQDSMQNLYNNFFKPKPDKGDDETKTNSPSILR